MSKYRIQVQNIHKKFPGVYSLQGVSLNVLKGEVHAIVGENGAGKSTLMKIINGQISPNQGKIIYNDKEVNIKNTREARKLGISMIHQELTPLPNMTIADNLFLGNEICYGNTPFVKKKNMIDETKKILSEFNLNVSPKTLMDKLTVSQTQMIEIIKSIKGNSDLIIMDEPTSSISDEEANKLFSIINKLKQNNVSIIYISHKLEEILNIADRITVLRDGTYIGTYEAKEVNKEKLIELMVGRKLENIYPKEDVDIGDTALEVKNISRKNVFENISFSVRKGEILGLFGLVGAGRTEIIRAIFGMDKIDSGEIYVFSKKVNINSTYEAIKNKIVMVSEDRKKYGLVLVRSIRENISLPNLKNLFKGLLINTRNESNLINDYKNKLSIKCSSINVTTDTLSGGNQQKIVIAKWLLSNPKILILDEPTRGIDVGAKFEIYKLMIELAKNGIAIIMISSELPEILGMSDRILVVSKGKISSEYHKEDIRNGKINQENILTSAL